MPVSGTVIPNLRRCDEVGVGLWGHEAFASFMVPEKSEGFDEALNGPPGGSTGSTAWRW